MSGHHKHLSTDPKHPSAQHQQHEPDDHSGDHPEISPKESRTEIHAPIQLRTSQTKIHTKEQKSDAHLCITSLRGGRANARRQHTIPRSDLGIVSVDLVGGISRC